MHLAEGANQIAAVQIAARFARAEENSHWHPALVEGLRRGDSLAPSRDREQDEAAILPRCGRIATLLALAGQARSHAKRRSSFFPSVSREGLTSAMIVYFRLCPS